MTTLESFNITSGCCAERYQVDSLMLPTKQLYCNDIEKYLFTDFNLIFNVHLCIITSFLYFK